MRETIFFLILEYKHAIILHKLYNIQIPQMEWIELNFNQKLTSRETFLIKSNPIVQKSETIFSQIGSHA